MGSGDPSGLQNRREAGFARLRCVRLAHASAKGFPRAARDFGCSQSCRCSL